MELDFEKEKVVDGLPAGWEMVTLKNIVRSSIAGFSCNKSFEEEGGYVHLRTHNINTNGKLDFSKIVRIKHGKVDERKNFLKKGDILFNNTNSQELVGKTAFVGEDLPYGYSNHLNRILVKENADPKFIVYYLNQLQSSGFFAKICNKWVGQAGVNTTQLMNLQIPLPPLAEQQRIVAKLDALFERIDEAIALTEEALKSVQNLLPAALDEVFGKAEEKGWEMKKIQDLGDLLSGQHILGANYNEQGVGLPYLTGPSDFGAKYPHISKWTELPKVIAKRDSILITVKGSGVGKLNFCNLEKVAISRQIMAFSSQKLLPDFAYYFFASNEKKLNDSAIGAAIPGIDRKTITQLWCPFPNVVEQEELVGYLNLLSLKSEENEIIFVGKKRFLQRLKQALLKEEFRF